MKYILSISLLLLFSFPTESQEWRWASGSSPLPLGNTECGPIAADRLGNVYELANARPGSTVTGYLQSVYGAIDLADSASPIWQQGVLVSTDSNGVYRWALGSQDGDVSFTALATDPFGNIYVIGAPTNGFFRLGTKSWNSSNYFCAKINNTGNVLWIKALAPGVNAAITQIAVNEKGAIYVTGSFNQHWVIIGSDTLINTDSTGAIFNVLIAKYDSSGNPIWAKNFRGDGDAEPTAFTLTTDSQLYIAGYTLSDSMIFGRDTMRFFGSNPYFMLKLDINGNPIWGRTNRNDTNITVLSISADPEGSVYFTGIYDHTLVFANDTLPVPPLNPIRNSKIQMYLAKYDSSGNEKWVRNRPIVFASSVSADACGNIWVSGGKIQFPDSMFLFEFDSTGMIEDSLLVNSGGDDANSIFVQDGNLYVGGDYAVNHFYVGPYILTLDTTQFGEALFVLRYKYGSGICKIIDTVSGIPTATTTPGISIYPNPATWQCVVQNDRLFNEGSRIEIYDITGRLIHNYRLSGNSTSFSVSDLPSGLYECRIYDEGYGVETKKLVVMR